LKKGGDEERGRKRKGLIEVPGGLQKEKKLEKVSKKSFKLLKTKTDHLLEKKQDTLRSLRGYQPGFGKGLKKEAIKRYKRT